ncbi:hypothetical protein NBRC116493_21500 [Aurantivibrio infirmus]
MKYSINQDIVESMQQRGSLEDSIYLQLDKLQALCSAQTVLNASEAVPTSNTRTYYSMVIEEQTTELRKLIDILLADNN